jgi:hypothetical protein
LDAPCRHPVRWLVPAGHWVGRAPSANTRAHTRARTHARTHAQRVTRAHKYSRARAPALMHARSAEGGGRTSHVRVTAHRHVPVAGLKPCTATAAPTPT